MVWPLWIWYYSKTANYYFYSVLIASILNTPLDVIRAIKSPKN